MGRENGNSAMDLTSSLYMKTPKRKMEKTTTRIERLLFLRPFIVPVSAVNRGDFLRGGCIVRERNKSEKQEREDGWGEEMRGTI